MILGSGGDQIDAISQVNYGARFCVSNAYLSEILELATYFQVFDDAKTNLGKATSWGKVGLACLRTVDMRLASSCFAQMLNLAATGPKFWVEQRTPNVCGDIAFCELDEEDSWLSRTQNSSLV